MSSAGSAGGVGCRSVGTIGRDRVTGRARRSTVDVLVVGGGRAGVAAAERGGSGGSTRRVGGGRRRARSRTGRRASTLLDGATVVGWYDGVVTAIDDETLWSIRAALVVAATGSYERVPSVRGADRPGVMGARLVHRLVDACTGSCPASDRCSSATPTDLAAVAAALARRRRADRSDRSRPRRCGACSGGRRVTGAIVEVDGRARRESGRSRRLRRPDAEPRPRPRGGAAVERRDGVLVPVLDARGTDDRAGAVGRRAPRPVAPSSVVAAQRVGRSSASARTSTPTRSTRRSPPATATRSSSSAAPGR